MTMITLKQQSACQLAIGGMAKGRADKPFGPTKLETILDALPFGTVMLKKICQAESWLKLNFVSRNDCVPPVQIRT